MKTERSGETVYRDHRRDAELPDLAKEVSVFDWEYDATETCYVMEGEVKVTTPESEFGAGDLVTFPRGLGWRPVANNAAA